MNRHARYVVLALLGLAAAAGIGLALKPSGIPVETGKVVRGPLDVHVEGSGRVRVRDRFVVGAPVTGHLERPSLRAGDTVEGGAVVSRISPAAPFPLDRRTRAEAEARLSSAAAAEAEARNAVLQAEAALDHAKRELSRLRKLSEGGAVAPRALEAAEFEASMRGRAVTSAVLAAKAAAGTVEASRAALVRAGGPDRRSPGEAVAVTAPPSPAPFKVLRVLQENEGPVQAGTPILELGDPSVLEAVADLLTTDAVRVQRGARVILDGWGGGNALSGRVRLVEPSAFTKISALGVEEQRVLVLIDPDGAGWGGLSDGYRVETRILVSGRQNALKVPVSALFRDRDGWSAFAVRGGKAISVRVEVGLRGRMEAEVLSGLEEGEEAILYPGDKISDGTRVRPVQARPLGS